MHGEPLERIDDVFKDFALFRHTKKDPFEKEENTCFAFTGALCITRTWAP
jgi:hypothetical protein